MSQGDNDQEQLRIWIALANDFDLKEWDHWLEGLHECGAKRELSRERAALHAAHRNGQHDRVADKIKILATRRSMIESKSMAVRGIAATQQNRKASASAKVERMAEARQRRLLARKLFARVSERIRLQGKAAAAREVRRLALGIIPRTEVSARLAAMSDRRLSDLIFDGASD